MGDEAHYLVMDIGNNRGKAALFLGPRVIQRFVFSSKDPSAFLDTLKSMDPEIPMALTMVSHPGEAFLESLQNHKSLLIMNGNTATPLRLKYDTPHTLGADRLAAAVGAFTSFPAQDVFIVDAGTCITMDLVNASGVYMGGSISPGIKMRLKAMNQFTERLPMVEQEEEAPWIGKDTSSSLKSGAYLGAVAEIEGRITRLLPQYPELRILLTGGDAYSLCKKINFNIFVMPDLVLHGLRATLLHHESTKK